MAGPATTVWRRRETRREDGIWPRLCRTSLGPLDTLGALLALVALYTRLIWMITASM